MRRYKMFRKILYPIDSYESVSAVSAHMKTFKQAGTQEVVALGIVELGGCAWTGRNLEQCRADRFEKERTEIQSILKEMEKDGVKGKIIIEAGSPAHTILKVADEEKVSLIVIGPGRGNIKGLLLGKAVEDVVRHAKVPVLVMR
jgi:nucleotide-binding universal stress UspA family protein